VRARDPIRSDIPGDLAAPGPRGYRRLAKALRAKTLAGVENHHDFAWREEHDGRDVIVHRKGATPAGQDVLGVIPGSMATPGHVVRGRGEAASLRSAAHGVTVLSAGLDEVPGVSEDIEAVMAAQADLVEAIARSDPRIVTMAPAGERPED